ncbi:TetR/AcrR family transcriptional regulator [Pseudofrankia sp. EUN1h]|uniref:TetR/AcrR family transcriptional regulator n=1 Tax=Pseudofrankia sp. EUN1h TaxID=1834515 RepID=UPI0009F587C8|nr:TetR family transcriptional regulator [Pseudofrankia sp. EUN1h]
MAGDDSAKLHDQNDGDHSDGDHHDGERAEDTRGGGGGGDAGRAQPPGRGAATRALILETALASFRGQGYERTTMRGIAQSAGVSLGNAYYYFGSKEHLVQEFYDAIQAGHRRRAAEALRSPDLADRLRRVIHAGIDEMTRYHSFAGSFIKVAIPPGAAASPFSQESTAARDAAIGLFRDVLEGPADRPGAARSKAPGGPLAPDLPELLWLAYLGITLFWVYDTSPGQVRTRRLVDAIAPLIARSIALTRVPVLRSVADDLHALLSELRLPGSRR